MRGRPCKVDACLHWQCFCTVDKLLLAQIWGTGLSGGARAVVLFNRHFDEAVDYDNSSITLHWHHLGWETDMPVRAPPLCGVPFNPVACRSLVPLAAARLAMHV